MGYTDGRYVTLALWNEISQLYVYIGWFITVDK